MKRFDRNRFIKQCVTDTVIRDGTRLIINSPKGTFGNPKI